MEILEIEVPCSKIIEFIKSRKHIHYDKVYISRFEETGLPMCSEWSDIFSLEERSILKNISKFIEVDNTEWPTFFLFKTVEYSQNYPTPSINADKHFITMNGKLHYHRCLIMDELNVLGLLEKNEYSWHGDNCKNVFYKWKSNIKTKRLNDNFDIRQLDSSYKVPVEQFQRTAFNLVLESQCDNILTDDQTAPIVFLTEKTFTPILHKKPCIILSNWRHWKTLLNLGFKSYPFIDYSFDDKKKFDERTQLFINEITRICKEYTPREIENLSKQTCEYNYNRLLEIYKNKIGQPSWLSTVIRY